MTLTNGHPHGALDVSASGAPIVALDELALHESTIRNVNDLHVGNNS